MTDYWARDFTLTEHLEKSEDGWMIGMIGILSFNLAGM